MKLFKILVLITADFLIMSSAFGQKSNKPYISRQGKSHLLYQISGKSSETQNSSTPPGLSVWKSRNTNNKQSMAGEDTLNYPLAGTYALYVSTSGYVSGNNEFGDKVKAEYFHINQPVYLQNILIGFAVATSSQANIEIAVWDNGGANGHPGNKLGSTHLVLDDILNDILNNQTTSVAFDNPILLNTPFYIGAYLPTSAGDTLVVYSNTDGDTNPASAWEQWSDDTWYPMDDPNGWGLNIAHAIFPIVSYSDALSAAFSANPTQLLPGNTVQFTDESFGNPVSWNWTFNGGNPISSTEQNPAVLYNQTGDFSVKLIVSDGELYDTLVKTNYISVVNEMPANLDTLIYPLPGTYVVYIITDHGGFVTGNNKFNDKAKANYFELAEAGQIIGVLYEFAWAVGGNPQIDLNIWDNDGGTTGDPGTILTGASIPLDNIKTDVENQALTFFAIDPPLQINHPFYAGFTLPSSAGDTLVAWSNTDGDTNPAIIWDLWNDDTWHHFSATYNLNIAMGVHPIVEYPSGIQVLNAAVHSISVQPNPTTGHVKMEIPVDEKNLISQVYNSEGELLLSKKYGDDGINAPIDLSSLASGNYLVRLITDKKVYSAKVVKE